MTGPDTGSNSRPNPGPAHTGVVVVGSGVAGLSVAIRLARAGEAVTVLTKGAPDDGATAWAQGGIAVVLDPVGDSPQLHATDTIGAGAGLCDTDAVRVLVEEGPGRVRELMVLGARFDGHDGGILDGGARDGSGLERSREGGHSRARVVHAGGAATGAEVERALLAALADSGARICDSSLVLELVVSGDRCRGVVALDEHGRRFEVAADHVVLATGGAGRLYAVTTSPPASTGDGIALALRAGVPVADVEFIQFHPTALAVDRFPRLLLSEALRGEGALLVDPLGRRFVDELAPRDVVSRAMAAVAAAHGGAHLHLDARPVEHFAKRFPALATALADLGLDPSVDLLPVAPAAHYLCGGVLTDLDGASGLDRLWAVGEVACNGVHGANRLASNSLLDGLVFGARAAEAILAGREGALATGALGATARESGGAVPLVVLDAGPTGRGGAEAAPAPAFRGDAAAPHSTTPRASTTVAEIQSLFSARVGVVRDAAGLAEVRSVLDAIAASTFADAGADADPRGRAELATLVAVGGAVVDAAAAREESRGAHTRAEWDAPRPEWHCRIVRGNREWLEAVGNRTGAARAPGAPRV